jgi:hypothetical protein
MRLMLLCLSLAIAACGDDPANPPPTCSGMTCACMAGMACDFSVATCGNSCSLACSSQNTCNGTCGDSCSIQCSGGSSCAVTVGVSGSVSCGKDSICQVTCTGGCSLSCSDGARCQIRCPGDSGFREAASGGRC